MSSCEITEKLSKAFNKKHRSKLVFKYGKYIWFNNNWIEITIDDGVFYKSEFDNLLSALKDIGYKFSDARTIKGGHLVFFCDEVEK